MNVVDGAVNVCVCCCWLVVLVCCNMLFYVCVIVCVMGMTIIMCSVIKYLKYDIA